MDIQQGYSSTGGSKQLPRLPESVGGSETDLMIGIKYFRNIL